MSRESQYTRFEDQILGQVGFWGRPASCASLQNTHILVGVDYLSMGCKDNNLYYDCADDEEGDDDNDNDDDIQGVNRARGALAD